jgi:hypothetical protein
VGLTLHRGGAAATAGLLTLLGAALPVGGQAPGSWSVVSARLTADLTAGDGSAAVSIRYVLSGTPRGSPLPLDHPIPVDLLEFANATVAHVAVGGAERIVLWPTTGSHKAAVIVAPARAVPGAIDTPSEALAAEVLELDVTYRVERAVQADGVELRGRVPVLSGPSAPEPGAGGGFEARLLLPAEWRVREGFPSSLRAERAGVWSVVLPVTPSIVSFRARADGTWQPGLPLFIDVLTLVILGAFTAVGWRHLRRGVTTAEAERGEVRGS